MTTLMRTGIATYRRIRTNSAHKNDGAGSHKTRMVTKR
jgi:hypothetical protein